jgi:hypothetical protein
MDPYITICPYYNNKFRNIYMHSITATLLYGDTLINLKSILTLIQSLACTSK